MINSPIYNPDLHTPIDMFQILSFTPLHDHRRVVPKGTMILSGRPNLSAWQATFMAMPGDALVIPLHKHGRLEGQIARRFNTDIAPGDILTLPRGTPFYYQAQGGLNSLWWLSHPPSLVKQLWKWVIQTPNVSNSFHEQVSLLRCCLHLDAKCFAPFSQAALQQTYIWKRLLKR
ncbi:MAG TPA: hypothetical protein VFT66_14900 [Roseiflexaceae bacterium]|jgi:hypothetical protein|nr:hypothetical protein [Roseiflexaceae bacterium]